MAVSSDRTALLSVSSAPRQGIVLVLISGAVFTINDTAMKWLRADYPVGELVTIRGIFSLIVLACLIRFIGTSTLGLFAWRTFTGPGLGSYPSASTVSIHWPLLSPSTR